MLLATTDNVQQPIKPCRDFFASDKSNEKIARPDIRTNRFPSFTRDFWLDGNQILKSIPWGTGRDERLRGGQRRR
jgi:hypothetical protein